MKHKISKCQVLVQVNLLSYCVDARISASEKDLPVPRKYLHIWTYKLHLFKNMSKYRRLQVL